MFEKYTEKARRVIFFARYEVSQFGSAAIESEHLLLGLLREDKALIARFLPVDVSTAMLHTRITAQMIKGEKILTSLAIPLSSESKEILNYAAEESENLGQRHIGAEHLLLGLLRQEDSLAGKVLCENGVNLSTVRQQIKDGPGNK